MCTPLTLTRKPNNQCDTEQGTLHKSTRLSTTKVFCNQPKHSVKGVVNMSKKYCVLTVFNETLKSVHKEFVPPNEKLSETLDRYSDNWSIQDIKYGDYEFYLNQKLDYAVEEYNESYKCFRETCKRMLTESNTSFRVGLDSLNCIITNLEVSEKKIKLLVNRMIGKDFNIQNEEAHLIYDLIAKQGRSF